MYFRKIVNTPWFRVISFGLLLVVVLLLTLGPKLPSKQNRRIVVADDHLAHLMVSWQKTWQRPPTREEMTNLIQNHVRDEVLYREAINQGLDQNNAMVRRSLIMQMNLLAENQVEQAELSETEVRSFYNLRKDQYQEPAKISFRHVYFDNQNFSKLQESEIQALIDQLNQQPDRYRVLGDPIMLEPLYTRQTSDQVDRQFGADFARELFGIDGNTWAGPISSGYGTHLVQVTEMISSGDTPLEAVWDQVVNDMLYEEKQAAKEQFYTELLRQYNISYQGVAEELISDQ